MNAEENKKRIIELSMKYRNININILRDNYMYSKYLEDIIELNVRLILRKYYNGEVLGKENLENIAKYIFYSSPFMFLTTNEENSNFNAILNRSLKNSNFSDDEIKILRNINKSKNMQ